MGRRVQFRAAGPIAIVATIAIAGACTGASPPSPSSTAASERPTPSGSSSGDSTWWTTYQHDAARTGQAPVGPRPGRLHRVWRSSPLDGVVYAQPLVFDGSVVVATENDSVYALSETGGKVLWRTHVGQPVPRSSLPCGNIDPTGITGTPAIDPASGLIFVVAFVMPGIHELLGIDAANGRIRIRRRIDAPGSDPLVQQERGALTLANGRVYVPYGGLFGDCGQYHGYVVAVAADGRGRLASYRVPTGRAGGIWSPSGLTLGAGGDLYAATGNSDSTAAFDLGDSVLRLSPALHLVDSFAPANWAALNAGDVDLGSVGPTRIAGGLVFQVGKEGVGYLLRAGHLGGIGGQLDAEKVCGAAFGATARLDTTVFVPCVEGLVSVRVHDGSTLSVGWRGPSFDAGPPVTAGGVVWCMDVSGGVLYAFDGSTGRALARTTVGPVTRFTTPSISGRRLFVASADRVLALTGA